jgi:hypothetical protein
MEQQTVAFSATILDPLVVDPALEEELGELCKDALLEPELKPELKLELPTPPPIVRQCCIKPLPTILEHPYERFERQSELGEALPSIFIAFGIAYALGVLTGGMIFSSPSMVPAL